VAPAMSSPSSCKCLHCREFFVPCSNNRRTQHYCSKAECRKASEAAAQAKWLNKPQNRCYFRGPENVERVRRWREHHPGYWRKKRSPPADALQDLAPIELPQNQPVTLSEERLVADDFIVCEPSGLLLPVRYKISPVFKCLCWRELCRCSSVMRYKIALHSLLASS
jgi:hypothetical protein